MEHPFPSPCPAPEYHLLPSHSLAVSWQTLVTVSPCTEVKQEPEGQCKTWKGASDSVFAGGDEQERERKSSLWLLHFGEWLAAKCGMTEGNVYWRQHSKVGCLCLHSGVPVHSEGAEGLGQEEALLVLQRSTTSPCLLIRTQTLFQLLCGSVLQREWSWWVFPHRGFLTVPLKCRAECPTVHLPSTHSLDTGYPLLFLHLDVALSINHTSVGPNIFKIITLLQKLYKPEKYQLPSSWDYLYALCIDQTWKINNTKWLPLNYLSYLLALEAQESDKTLRVFNTLSWSEEKNKY